MSNETIFREVDEELRGDRMRAIWRRFGPYVIGGAVAVVLVVAVNEGWNWWQNSIASRSSDQFYAALELAEGGDITGAQAALNEVAAQGTGGYPTLARFRQASLLARDGKRTEAIAAYDALATAETNARLRELALILAAYLAVDDGDVAAVQQRVVGLLDPAHPMRNAALEAVGLAQYKAGDLDAALRTLTEIAADPLAEKQVLSRAQVYVAQLVSLGATTEDAAADPAEELPAAETSVGEDPVVDVEAEAAPAADAAPATEAAPAEPAGN